MKLELGAFVVMPNHFHGILIIGENEFNAGRDAMPGVSRTPSDPMHGVNYDTAVGHGVNDDRAVGYGVNDDTTVGYGVNDDRAAMHGGSTAANTFGPQSKNLASVIRGFKSSVTTRAKKMGCANFEWQPRFYEHIIRDARAFENIQNYIQDNPANWAKDKFYP